MTQPKYDRAQLEDLVLQMMETELGGEKIYRAAIATAIATAVGRVRCRAAQVGWLVVRRVRAPFALRAVGGPV